MDVSAQDLSPKPCCMSADPKSTAATPWSSEKQTIYISPREVAAASLAAPAPRLSMEHTDVQGCVSSVLCRPEHSAGTVRDAEVAPIT